MKTKLVVVDEHTLGYISPVAPQTVNVLRASGLRGSPHPDIGSFSTSGKKIRLASREDFEAYRVSDEYFKHPADYEFAE